MLTFLKRHECHLQLLNFLEALPQFRMLGVAALWCKSQGGGGHWASLAATLVLLHAADMAPLFHVKLLLHLGHGLHLSQQLHPARALLCHKFRKAGASGDLLNPIPSFCRHELADVRGPMGPGRRTTRLFEQRWRRHEQVLDKFWCCRRPVRWGACSLHIRDVQLS